MPKHNKCLEPIVKTFLDKIYTEISKREIYITEQRVSKLKQSVYLTLTKDNKKYYRVRISDHAGNPSTYDLGLWIEKKKGLCNNIDCLNPFLDKIQQN